jgi:hypothetical protein
MTTLLSVAEPRAAQDAGLEGYVPALSISAKVGEPMNTGFMIAMMPLTQKSRPSFGVVLFFDPGRAWCSRTLNKHGTNYLATMTATLAAAQFADMSPRATSLKYPGRQDRGAVGLAEDLRKMNFDEDTIARLLAAAEPYWKPARSRTA